MTWTRSSYMEPVTSKTNARVDAPSGMSSFVAPARASCPAQNATDSARDSHTNLQPISAPRCFSASSWVFCSRQSEPQNESRLEARDIGLSKMDWSVFWKKNVRKAELQPAAIVRYHWFLVQFLCAEVAASHLSVNETSAVPAAAAVPVVCSQEPLFSPVIQRPPLSWAESPPGANYPMQNSGALIGRDVLGDFEGPCA